VCVCVGVRGRESVCVLKELREESREREEYKVKVCVCLCGCEKKSVCEC
jgi:hypothetical protein